MMKQEFSLASIPSQTSGNGCNAGQCADGLIRRPGCLCTSTGHAAAPVLRIFDYNPMALKADQPVKWRSGESRTNKIYEDGPLPL